MPYLLVRHKVSDFCTWKAAYDANLRLREDAGLKEELFLRNVDDPNEVFLLFKAARLQNARDFAASPELRQKMMEAGVVERPDLYFLE
jgi:hypothetical protein